ncbi:hypothetical protein L0Y40_03310 [Candidatus Wolfebacteria bacterium]|nr:hypothetical protein [Candidatus Wolfebacteria bacterium]
MRRFLHVIEEVPPLPPSSPLPPEKRTPAPTAPRNESTYRLIQLVFPDFRWEVGENGQVSFTNYPTVGANPRIPKAGDSIPLGVLREHFQKVLNGEPSDLEVDPSEVRLEAQGRVRNAQRERRRYRKQGRWSRRRSASWAIPGGAHSY